MRDAKQILPLLRSRKQKKQFFLLLAVQILK
jgi:hypothetical protein